MEHIPFLRPNLVRKEAFLPYLEEIERSRLYTNYGPLNSQFEARVLAEYFGNQGAATTVHNATLGLILAISQTRRPRGRYALMPSFTFAATPLAAMWCGLTPYFVDVDGDDWMMQPAPLRETIARLGDEVAVVVPYAAFGCSFDLQPYAELQDAGIPVVVDAAASFGGTVYERHFGQGFAGAVVFSFHATKSFGVGEGGLAYSGDPTIIAKLRRAGNFGFGDGREATTLGLNAKVSEYTAAIALATLDHYPAKCRLRAQIYDSYLDLLRTGGAFGRGWQTQKLWGSVAHQFFPILCPAGETNADYVAKLAEANIQARTYFAPACHQQRQFRDCPRADLAVTETLTRRILSLPLWEEIRHEQLVRVVESLL